ncbi:hypothetical protein [Tenacibaculum xiamenense]|uniref:hypothetical protein n=1 Tax=Tenacibaculum xiamenense TaxID=1261553 RepID=UPI003893A980
MKTLKVLSIIMLVLSFLSCSKTSYNGIRVKNWKMKMDQHEYKVSFTDFNGSTQQELPIKNIESLTIVINSKIEKGKVYFQLVDHEEKSIWKEEINTIKSIEKTILINSNKTYRIKLYGENATGNFSSTWD